MILKTNYLFVVSTGLIALAMGVAGPASAQDQTAPARSSTSGISISAYLSGAALSAEDANDVDSGGGLSVRVGYGISEQVQIYTELSRAAIEYADINDTYALSHFDLGARYNFGTARSALRPYLNGAFSGRAASMDLGIGVLDLRGFGFTAGGGLYYFLSSSIALEGTLNLTFGSFSEGRFDSASWEDLGRDSIGATSVRFNLGLSWYP